MGLGCGEFHSLRSGAVIVSGIELEEMLSRTCLCDMIIMAMIILRSCRVLYKQRLRLGISLLSSLFPCPMLKCSSTISFLAVETQILLSNNERTAYLTIRQASFLPTTSPQVCRLHPSADSSLHPQRPCVHGKQHQGPLW